MYVRKYELILSLHSSVSFYGSVEVRLFFSGREKVADGKFDPNSNLISWAQKWNSVKSQLY